MTSDIRKPSERERGGLGRSSPNQSGELEDAHVQRVAGAVLGLKLRLRAYREKHGLPAPTDSEMRFIPSAVEIMKPDRVAALLAKLDAASFRPGLIIVDTLARVALGADENSASDMGRVVDGFDELKRKTGATVLVIHHSRKDGGAERGSSALKGALDAMIRCESLGDGPLKGVSLNCKKMKDGEPFEEFFADLESVKLPSGETSLVLAPPTDFLAQMRSGTAEKIIDLLRTQFAETGATHGELRKAFVAVGFGAASTLDRAWRETRTKPAFLDVAVKTKEGKWKWSPMA